MNIVTITDENLEREHICCAISNNKDCQFQVAAKKSWLAERFKDGLVFKKGDVPGKCFIEYIPAEKAWCPIEAEGYTHINCFWVSGQLKGHGYSNLLLAECIKDSKEKGKKGLCILSSKKKIPFLSDPQYLKYKAFAVADTAEPFYELLYLRPLLRTLLNRVLSNRPKRPRSPSGVLFCIIRINAPLRQNMCR